MSRKVCLLRSSAEVEGLAVLLVLKELVQQHHITEAEARSELDRFPLPDCTKHHHVSKREARRRERMNRIAFVPGWGEQYAKASVWGQVSGGSRKFQPADVFSGDQIIGRLEMYAT